ncbi:MAG: cysteine desulfurase [Lachnospiraceae bacterium]|nr:cysteine desulfurase [Lachnospiraceae bacterium]
MKWRDILNVKDIQRPAFDVERVRADFPLISGTELAYLDNSATTQKPKAVLDAEREYYENYNANPFRGLYDLSTEATDRYEHARETVARFIGAKDASSVIFTRNATESLNLVAYSFGELLKEGDELIVAVSEHHSNLLPWRAAAKRKGAVVRYLFCDATGAYSLDDLRSLINERTRLITIAQISNVFGRLNDIKAMAALAHEVGAVLVCDGAQSVPHLPVNVTDLDVDFLAFSGHKILASMGIGVLYGKRELLDKMPPFLSGGEMIETVSLDSVAFATVPHKFEAGTVNAGGAISLEAAIRYLEEIDREKAIAWEDHLTRLMFEGMKNVPHVNIVGAQDPDDHHGILTFTIDNVHPHDVSAIFADSDIAVRAGHHCAEPLHQHLGIPSTTRASLMFYNTEEEVKRFLECLAEIRPMMGYRD